MSVTATIKRRRKQMRKGEPQLPPLRRPIYVQRSKATMEAREIRRREKERERMSRSKKK